MTIRSIVLAAAMVGALFAQGPLPPAYISPGAVIETIQFDGVAAPKQAAILDRIGVRTGDMLSIETRQRIGRELNKGEKVGEKAGETGLTFSYKPGTHPGTAIVVISSGC